MDDSWLELLKIVSGPQYPLREVKRLLDIEEVRNSLNRKGDNRRTVLHLVAEKARNHDTIELLLDNGANKSINSVNNSNKTPLYLALGQPANTATIRLLLDHGAAELINLVDKDSKTPLHLVVD
jgi:ankyrin repeat protein